MSSTAQTSANRENSKHSSGPRTPEGKAASSQNSKTHGFSAADPVLPNEDRKEFNALLVSYQCDLVPETAHEEFLVKQIAGAHWKLDRLQGIETAMFAALEDITQAMTNPETAIAFTRLERYRASLERTYHRCVRELRAARKQEKQNEANSAQAAESELEAVMRDIAFGPIPGWDEAVAESRKVWEAQQAAKKAAQTGS